MRRQSKAAMTCTRATGAALAAALLLGQIVASTHERRVAHVTCEHGQVVHAEASPADAARDRTLAPIPPHAADHEHGCAILWHSRSLARPAVISTPSAPLALAARIALAPTPTLRSTTLRFAPSRSPPT